MNKELATVIALAAMLLGFSGRLAFMGTEAAADDVSSASKQPHSAEAEPLYLSFSHFQQALLNPKRLPPLPLELIDNEVLWLARCIYSETKRAEEQELVAWVIRNRVETQYRGKGTYQDVILDPYQFSAFLPSNKKRRYYSRLAPHSSAPGWQRALRIAFHVRNADEDYRPFSVETRHFFSERSMYRGKHPRWASGQTPVRPDRFYTIDEFRFRFFEGIA